MNSNNAPAVLEGSVSIDADYVRSLGIRDAASEESSELYRTGRLSAEQRLYCSLSEAGILNQCLLEPRQVVLRKGQSVTLAHFIVLGTLLAKGERRVFRFDAGAVIGVAEAISGKPANFDVIAVSTVSAWIFPVQKIASIMLSILRPVTKILQTVARRSIELPHVEWKVMP